jgi:hypothetical protein
MVDDTTDDARDMEWDEQMALTFNLIEQLIDKEEEAENMGKDPPKKVHCNICGRYRTETRCLYHIRAKGCHFCHLQTDLHKPT